MVFTDDWSLFRGGLPSSAKTQDAVVVRQLDDVPPRWLDVCICRMHRKRASCARFVKVVASWFRRSVGSPSGQASVEAPGPSVHGRMRLASSLRMSMCRESCANFPEVSLQLLCPSEWKLVAYGASFAKKTSQFLKHLPSCLLSGDASDFLLKILRCCCALEKTFKKRNFAFSHASYLCVWLLGRLCLIFEVDAHQNWIILEREVVLHSD